MAALYPKDSEQTKGASFPKDDILQRSFHELFRGWIQMWTKVYMPHSAPKAIGNKKFPPTN